MKNKFCEWCDSSFEPSVSYQIYCSPSCREQATREKIAERYSIKRRSNASRRSRKCKACDNKLSTYNDENLCSSCLINPKEVSKTLREIKGLSNGKDKP